MNPSKSFRTITLALSLAILAGLLGVAFWQVDVFPLLHQAFLLAPEHTGEQIVVPDLLIASAIIISLSIATGLAVARVGTQESVPYIAGAYLSLAIVSLFASRFLAIDTLCVPSGFAIGLTVAAMHVARLSKTDRELSNLLFERVKKISSEESEEATSRLMSGLRLLETELSLVEAVIFQLQNGVFVPAARSRTISHPTGDSTRNSAWRKGIVLCERAAATRQIVTQDAGNGTSNVAVPLRHENQIVGALMLRLTGDLRDEDRPLLTAVSAQMARNLQRQEFCNSIARSRAFGYFSTTHAQAKLNALNVLNGLLTEQRCGENVLAAVTDGVAIAHLDGTLVFVNAELQRLANVPGAQLQKFNIFGLLDRFRTDVFDEPPIAVRRVLQSGEAYEGELRFAGRSEIFGLRIALINDSLHSGGSGQPLCLAIYVRDLTRIKEYEQLKSDMISLMSHELRTPLTSINGFSELLCAEQDLPEQAREFVTIIGNESQRLSRMINTFLAVTQLERKDKQEVLKIPLRLNEVVKETIMSLQPTAKKKRIRLIEQPAPRLPPVAADKSLITQAVKNLVNNAIRYSPERTTVTISTALEAESVRLSVEDRGFGIPPESRDRVWEKFYRVVREGQEKDEESTGLGLSFVREVVEQHGGNVNLESEEGRGSKFSFTLPRL
ncbi:MAG TPA: ATP-binding protein [Pyrinomonadaceae bacterium]|nr:ATP-binding protein [Pyrinomonadaceae bacterium]